MRKLWGSRNLAPQGELLQDPLPLPLLLGGLQKLGSQAGADLAGWGGGGAMMKVGPLDRGASLWGRWADHSQSKCSEIPQAQVGTGAVLPGWGGEE